MFTTMHSYHDGYDWENGPFGDNYRLDSLSLHLESLDIQDKSIDKTLLESIIHPPLDRSEDSDTARHDQVVSFLGKSPEFAKHFMRPRVVAMDLTDIFPVLLLYHTSLKMPSKICAECMELGKWLNRTSSSSFVNSYGVNLFDTLVTGYLDGCKNCRFMLGSLSLATFTSESRNLKAPTYSATTYDKGYEVKLVRGGGGRGECLLRLEVVFKKKQISYEGDGKNLGVMMKASQRMRNARAGRHEERVSYVLASCSLVFSNGTMNTLPYPSTPFVRDISLIAELATGKDKFIDADPRSGRSISLVSSWLEQCQHHDRCPSQKDTILPTRVIKIPTSERHHPRLWTTNGSTGKYIALSHCWGQGVHIRTLLSTLKSLEHEIESSTLPRSFLDAIFITKNLGFSYIWIDSLCIVQDSPQDWANECSKMASVYANASLVIGAASAADSAQGFLNLRQFRQGPQFDYTGSHLREKLTSRVARTTSPLSTRGWTYQEALLAPRLLLYTKNQMTWECRHGSKDEGVNVIESSNESCSKKQFFEVIDTDVPDLHDDTSEKSEGLLSTVNKSLFRKTICARLNTWYTCVEDYSPRQLTNAFDKLPALSGLASAIHHPSFGDYLAGLWSKDIGAGLFWTKHRAREELHNRPFHKCATYRAPSWSWASCEGAVDFHVAVIPTAGSESRRHITTDFHFDSAVQAAKYAPKLVKHEMLLATSDPYGQVLPGSYIDLEGYSRTMYPTDLSAGENVSNTFRLNREHSHVTERWTWDRPAPGADLPRGWGSRVLLWFLGNRCLILTYAGNNCWKRESYCELVNAGSTSEHDESVSNRAGSWRLSRFRLI